MREAATEYKTENRTKLTKGGPTECARQKTGLIISNTHTKVQICSKIKHTINYRQYNRIQFSNIIP